MSKQRNLRKRRALDDDDDEQQASASAAAAQQPGAQQQQVPQVQSELLADLKLLQKQRKRVAGVDAARLVPAARDDDEDGDGGDNELMDAQYVKAEGSKKSQLVDEDTHMTRYVEAELAKRLGKTLDAAEQRLSKKEAEERALYALPEGLEATLAHDMTLPGMMTAITEVEVSTEAKMRKIEETEAIKLDMLAKQTGQRPANEDDGRMAVRRGMFAFSFGKQQQRRVLSDEAAAGLQERRKYITERTRDPKDVARQQQHRGGRR